MSLEVRKNEDGSIDEIVAKNAEIHLEQMDHDEWWLRVSDGNTYIAVMLESKKSIEIYPRGGGIQG